MPERDPNPIRVLALCEEMQACALHHTLAETLSAAGMLIADLVVDRACAGQLGRRTLTAQLRRFFRDVTIAATQEWATRAPAPGSTAPTTLAATRRADGMTRIRHGGAAAAAAVDPSPRQPGGTL